MKVNKYKAICSICKKEVLPGDGRIKRTKGPFSIISRVDHIQCLKERNPNGVVPTY